MREKENMSGITFAWIRLTIYHIGWIHLAGQNLETSFPRNRLTTSKKTRTCVNFYLTNIYDISIKSFAIQRYNLLPIQTNTKINSPFSRLKSVHGSQLKIGFGSSIVVLYFGRHLTSNCLSKCNFRLFPNQRTWNRMTILLAQLHMLRIREAMLHGAQVNFVCERILYLYT